MWYSLRHWQFHATSSSFVKSQEISKALMTLILKKSTIRVKYNTVTATAEIGWLVSNRGVVKRLYFNRGNSILRAGLLLRRQETLYSEYGGVQDSQHRKDSSCNGQHAGQEVHQRHARPRHLHYKR